MTPSFEEYSFCHPEISCLRRQGTRNLELEKKGRDDARAVNSGTGHKAWFAYWLDYCKIEQMSGHSKWANIKRRKESQDQKRGQVFSKLARAIAIAVKEGGSVDPEANAKLRTLIQQAKEANMPKENINRAIEAGQRRSENLSQFLLEGYGPYGVAVVIDVATDNRQRSVQEIKNIFSHHQGRLAEPGAVTFQFSRWAEVATPRLDESELLKVMDFIGIQDWREEAGNTVFLLKPEKLADFLDFLGKQAITPRRSQIVMKAKSPLKLDKQKLEKAERFLAELEDHDDIQAVYTNLSG